jgi:hypothetical protein
MGNHIPEGRRCSVEVVQESVDGGAKIFPRRFFPGALCLAHASPLVEGRGKMTHSYIDVNI